jgi:hypothetical protein
MLQINLSTRPFYNERIVKIILITLLILGLGLSAFNLINFANLSSVESNLSAEARKAKKDAARLRAETLDVQDLIDAEELEVVIQASREATELVSRRSFSWSELLSLVERSLPGTVRLKSLRSRIEEDSFVVTFTVEARAVSGVASFIESLEDTGNFKNTSPIEETYSDQDLVETVMESIYIPSNRNGIRK